MASKRKADTPLPEAKRMCTHNSSDTQKKKRHSSNKTLEEHGRDQFFTADAVASVLFSSLLAQQAPSLPTLIIEPSAGGGAFCRAITALAPSATLLALDIEPKAPGIVEHDFFTYDFASVRSQRPLWVVGNPPFGVNASGAVRFFNRAAQHIKPDLIAFVMPRSMKKTSIERRLNVRYALQSSTDIPTDSFVLNGGVRDVRCLWQVWRRLAEDAPPRFIAEEKTAGQIMAEHRMCFMLDEGDADFIVQRVGERAGRVSIDRKEIARHAGSRNFYFVRCFDAATKAALLSNGEAGLNMEAVAKRDDTVSTLHSLTQRDVALYLVALLDDRSGK